MGSLILQGSSTIYADTQIFIYTVEKHPTYAALLRTVWEDVASGEHDVVTSELTLMEALIGPLKRRDTVLESDYERLFAMPGIRLLPITATVLRAAATLRAASSRMRTPDAIHVATAAAYDCPVLLTNDAGLRHATGLRVIILDDVLAM